MLGLGFTSSAGISSTLVVIKQAFLRKRGSWNRVKKKRARQGASKSLIHVLYATVLVLRMKTPLSFRLGIPQAVRNTNHRLTKYDL